MFPPIVSLVPSPIPPFQCCTQKKGEGFGDVRMMSHGRGLNWPGRSWFGLPGYVAPLLPTPARASAVRPWLQRERVHNRFPNLPCQHFSDRIRVSWAFRCLLVQEPSFTYPASHRSWYQQLISTCFCLVSPGITLTWSQARVACDSTIYVHT